MNADTPSSSSGAADATEPGREQDSGASADRAPARPRAPRKKAAPVAETGAAAMPLAAEGVSADAAEAVPPVRRTRRKTAVPDEVIQSQEPVQDAAPVQAPAEIPTVTQRPRRPRKEASVLQVAVLPVGEAAPADGLAFTGTPAVESSGEVSGESADISSDAALAPDAPSSAPQEGAAGRKPSRRRKPARLDQGGMPGADATDAGPGLAAGAQEGAQALDDGASEGAAAALPSELTTTDARQVFEQLAGGAWSPEDEAADPEAADAGHKRVLLPDPDAPKLHKVLAQSGIGSRRDMEQWIADGQVTVNGQPAHVGQRIEHGDRVAVKGKPVRLRIAPATPRLLAYHKPTGEVVTRDDPQGRPTVFTNLPALHSGKWLSVGRLDINTEGLLLFTNSGELANQLMHPRFGVEREYAVRVLGSLDDEARARLLAGVEVEGHVGAFKSIEDGGGEGVNHWYRVVITEGRNREVRKLFAAVGLTVSRLMRIRYASVVLPRGLRRGVWVELNSGDVQTLLQLTGLAGLGERRRRGPQGADRGQPRRGGQNGAPRQDGAGVPAQAQAAPSAGGKPQRGGKNRKGGQGGYAQASGVMGVAGEAARPMAEGQPRRQGKGGPGQNRPAGGDRAPSIPNPLMQTYDTRAIQNERRQARSQRFDDENGPIPNPLEQTYDKRFVQKKGFIGAGKGQRSSAPGGQPDPMQTSVGYIGADAFYKKMIGRGGGKRRG